jgi:hypothetical protein
MPGLVPGIHVWMPLRRESLEWPGQARPPSPAKSGRGGERPVPANHRIARSRAGHELNDEFIDQAFSAIWASALITAI